VAERYAEIVANSGINAKVQPDVWSKAVAAMISAIKDGRPGDGFVAAVELRRAAGPALPTRRTKPRRITEQGGRDLNRTLQLGFCFSAAPRC
jgi:putative membrane protein